MVQDIFQALADHQGRRQWWNGINSFIPSKHTELTDVGSLARYHSFGYLPIKLEYVLSHI